MAGARVSLAGVTMPPVAASYLMVTSASSSKWAV